MKAMVTFTCYYSYDVEGEDEGKCIDKAYDLYCADKVNSIADTTYDDVDIEVYAMKWDDEEEDLEVYEYDDEENEEEGSERNNND